MLEMVSVLNEVVFSFAVRVDVSVVPDAASVVVLVAFFVASVDRADVVGA